MVLGLGRFAEQYRNYSIVRDTRPVAVLDMVLHTW